MSIQGVKSILGAFVTGKAIVEVARQSFNYSLKPSCMIESLIARLWGEASTFASTDYCLDTNLDHYSASTTCVREYSTNFVDVMLVGSVALTLLSIAKRALFKNPVRMIIDSKSVLSLQNCTQDEWKRAGYGDIPWHRKDDCLLLVLSETELKILSKEDRFITEELTKIDRSNRNLAVCKRAWQDAQLSTRDKLITSLAETLPLTYKQCQTPEESVKLFNSYPAYYKGCATLILAELEKEESSYPTTYLTDRVRDAFGQYSYFLAQCWLMRDNLPQVAARS